MSRLVAFTLLLAMSASAWANPPVASYVFPAGGQRGSKVTIKVGGLFLHQACGFEMIGPGVKAPATLQRTHTLWFESPLLPLPESQQAEDYPKDMLGDLTIDAAAPLGLRHLRVATSQGVSPSLKFQIGSLPEIIESEIEGDAIPVLVKPPVTINGRIYPREDIDLWSIKLTKGETISCDVHAARLGSPLDARLDVLDPQGKVLIENEDAKGADPALRFTAPADGVYQIRIRDTQFLGGPAYVYRLTITTGPVVDRVFPLGGQRGSKVELALQGHAIPKTNVSVDVPKDAAASWQTTALAEKAADGAIVLDVDDLPEVVEGRGEWTKPLPGPVVFNGRIDKGGEVDSWSLQTTKGQTLHIELRASQLGSPLDGLVSVVDSSGKVLAKGEGDKSFPFATVADGVVTIKVQDRFRSRGGPAYAYRLRIAPPPEPDFRLTYLNDAVTVLRKGQGKLKVAAERIGGFKEPIVITAEQLPKGIKIAPLTLNAGQTSAELAFSADVDAPLETFRPTILGTVTPKDKSPKIVRSATAASGVSDALVVAIALPTPFTLKGVYDMGFAPRGTMQRRTYKIERNGYEGPIEVSLADRQARHLQGVEGPTITVPPGKNEFTYEAFLPPWMETGRTCRVCVQGVGVIKEGDREHKVAFSSVNQNEQLVAVVGPGPLAMDLEKASGVARAGQALEIPVRIKRGLELKGDVTIDLVMPPHLVGVSAPPVVIPAGKDQGTLTIRFASGNLGPFTQSLTVRATLRHENRPVVAEAALDVRLP